MVIINMDHKFNVQIYYLNYYELMAKNWKTKPILTEAQHAYHGWRGILLKLIDKGRMVDIAPHHIIKDAFNNFQNSSAPTWQKVATAFLSKDSLISPQHRETIIEALESLKTAALNGDECFNSPQEKLNDQIPGVIEIINKLNDLDAGWIVMTYPNLKTLKERETFADGAKIFFNDPAKLLEFGSQYNCVNLTVEKYGVNCLNELRQIESQAVQPIQAATQLLQWQ